MNPQYIGPERRRIESLFDDIAQRYDLTNSVLSFGIHKLWKRKLCRWTNLQPKQKILDCATGTGDLAFLYEKLSNHVRRFQQ